MEALKRDIEAMRVAQLNIDQLLDQITNETREDYGGKAGIHPVHVTSAHNYYKGLYSRLKFSFLELSAKEKFLHSVSSDPPTLATAYDVKGVEGANAAAAKQLKQKKQTVQELTEEVDQRVQHVLAARDRALRQVEEAAQLIREVEEMETEIAEIGVVVEAKQRRTIDEAEHMLSEQMQQLKQLNASIEERRQEVDDLGWELEESGQLLKQLHSERQRIDQQIEGYTRQSELQDQRVGAMHTWYKSAAEMLLQLLGVSSVLRSDPSTLMITFAPTGMPGKEIRLLVNLTEDTLSLQGARFVDKNIASRVPIDDVVAYAKQCNSLPILLTEIQARLLSVAAAGGQLD